MAKLFKTEYLPSDQCPETVDGECVENCSNDCPSRGIKNYETKAYDNGEPYVIWEEDLDLVLVSERDLRIFAEELGFNLVKKP